MQRIMNSLFVFLKASMQGSNSMYFSIKQHTDMHIYYNSQLHLWHIWRSSVFTDTQIPAVFLLYMWFVKSFIFIRPLHSSNLPFWMSEVKNRRARKMLQCDEWNTIGSHQFQRADDPFSHHKIWCLNSMRKKHMF